MGFVLIFLFLLLPHEASYVSIFIFHIIKTSFYSFFSFIFYLRLFLFSVCLLGVNYQDIGFNGAGLSGGAVSSVGGVGGEQLGGLLAPVSVQNLAALAAMTQPPVVTQAAPIAPAAATAAPQPTAPPLCKCASFWNLCVVCTRGLPITCYDFNAYVSTRDLACDGQSTWFKSCYHI